MNFPKQSLLVLLQFARGSKQLDQEVFDAALEVLRYVWFIVTSKTASDNLPSEQLDAVSALETVLAESEAKSFMPSVWITIGLWIAEKIIEKFLK